MLENLFKIKFFEEKYLEDVELINFKCLPENYNKSFYFDLYQRFPKTFLVATVGEKVVGYIMCRIELGFSEIKQLSLVKKGHIVSLAVLIEYRRRGIGRILTINALNNMKQYNVSESFLEVRVHNKNAFNLYKKIGFKPIRRIIRYYKDGEDAYVIPFFSHHVSEKDSRLVKWRGGRDLNSILSGDISRNIPFFLSMIL